MSQDTEPKTRIAVVLFNLGGPDNQRAVRPFLFNLFSDPAIISLPAFARIPLAAFIARSRAPMAKANYRMMGGGSPILPETTKQAQALEALLNKDSHVEAKVFMAMRYWKPFIAETAKEVAAFDADEVVLLPLYPQFSTTTTASSLRDWDEAASAATNPSSTAQQQTTRRAPCLVALAASSQSRSEDAVVVVENCG